MRFEDAVTGTLCGGALLLLMFGVDPRPQIPAASGEPPAVMLARESVIAGHPECIEH